MINFSAVRARTQSMQELARDLTPDDLVAATNAVTDDILRRIDGISDADVTFLPVDPLAEDEFASDTAEVGLPWTLGHVVVHLTASAEEAAFIACELARGVTREGRSRWETPWPTVTTTAQVHARLDESRRMILALLAAWPDAPHLDVTVSGSSGPRNAIARFLSGLSHTDAHLEQISEIVGQARAARVSAPRTSKDASSPS
jgi:hypothetical protein